MPKGSGKAFSAPAGSMKVTNKTKGMYGAAKAGLSNKLFVGPLGKRPTKSR